MAIILSCVAYVYISTFINVKSFSVNTCFTVCKCTYIIYLCVWNNKDCSQLLWQPDGRVFANVRMSRFPPVVQNIQLEVKKVVIIL